MKDTYIADIQDQKEVTDFFMVKDIAIKLGANRKQYLDLSLGDKTGEISGKKWDVADEEVDELLAIKEGDILKIRAQITEWNGMKQFRVMRVRKAGNEDQVDIGDFIKAAPYAPEEMYQYIIDTINNFKDEDLKALCLKLWTENKEKIMYYPAASKNHHAEMAGLLHHVSTMIKVGEKMCLVYEGLKKDLLLAGVMLHDIEKLNEIESNEFGISPGYSFEGQMLGHIIQGIKMLEREMEALNFPYEKKILVEHMILSHHYEPEYGSPKKPLFPEAEMLHYLDVMDARMYDMFDALSKTQEGDFSDRVWVLENRSIYNYKG